MLIVSYYCFKYYIFPFLTSGAINIYLHNIFITVRGLDFDFLIFFRVFFYHYSFGKLSLPALELTDSFLNCVWFSTCSSGSHMLECIFCTAFLCNFFLEFPFIFCFCLLSAMLSTLLMPLNILHGLRSSAFINPSFCHNFWFYSNIYSASSHCAFYLLEFLVIIFN